MAATFLGRYTRLCAGVMRYKGKTLQTSRIVCCPALAKYCLVPMINSAGIIRRHFSLEELEQEADIDDRLFSHVALVVKGSDEAVLDSYTQFVMRAAKILDLDISGRTVLDTHIEKRSLLKSPHIYKKHQAQYEIRTYGRMVQVQQLTGDTADIFLEYIQRNLPEGVSMNVEQTEVMDVPEYIRPPVQITHKRVEKTKEEQTL